MSADEHSDLPDAKVPEASTSAPASDTSRIRGGRLSRFYKRHSTGVHGVLTLLLGMTLWQLLAPLGSTLVIVPLGEIWESFVEQAASGQLWTDIASSLTGFAIGFIIAAVAGIAIGLIMAVNEVLFDFLDPWVSALYSTPLIALAPLYVVVFGIGMPVRIAVVVTLAIFPVIINTTAGIRTTDRQLIETARSFGARRMQIFAKILLPWSVPFVVTGLRLAIGRGLIAVVVAEFFGSTSGLGHAVFASAQNFDTASVWVGVFILAILGVLFIRLMYLIEKWVAPWRKSTVL